MTHEQTTDNAPPHQDAGSSPEHLDMRMIWFSGIGLIGIVALTFFVVSVMLNWLNDKTTENVANETRASFLRNADSETRVRTPLNPHQVEQRLNYEEKQRNILSSYGWIDSSQQTARIPIEQAMQRVVQQYQSEQ